MTTKLGEVCDNAKGWKVSLAPCKELGNSS